jgi:pyruvate dehydrogenase (quinone)
MRKTVAEQLVNTLADAGVRRVYGIVGDSLNPVTDAIRTVPEKARRRPHWRRHRDASG